MAVTLLEMNQERFHFGRRGLFATLTASLLLLTTAATVHATDNGVMTISPSIGSVEKSFPPIPAAKPDTPTTFFAQIRPHGCRTENAQYCDAVELHVDVPANYKKIAFVQVTLTYDPGVAGNQMNLYLWADDDPALGGPLASDTGAHVPKIAKMGDPPAGIYYITVVNSKPGNTGYKLKLEWGLTDLGPSYKKSPTPAPSPTPKSKAAAGPPVGNSFDFDNQSKQETKLIKVPGPDGELIDMAVPIVKVKGTQRQTTRGIGIVPIVLIGLGLSFAVFLYFFVWRRRGAAA